MVICRKIKNTKLDPLFIFAFRATTPFFIENIKAVICLRT